MGKIKQHSIFFDLETSTTDPIGQIINFSFIHLDPEFREVEVFSSRIRLNRLELPRAGAILANRVDVLELQETAKLEEWEAMRKIDLFLREKVESYGADKIALVGYNSARFDLNYLRTSLIRNGFNPYYKLISRDLYLLSRKLSYSDPDFPRPAGKYDRNKLSLSLENLTKAHGLLAGAQSHESEDDVRLTIDLARCYLEKYKIDIRSYDPYEIREAVVGDIVYKVDPQYDLKLTQKSIAAPYMLLDRQAKYALWVDLLRFQQEDDNKDGDYKNSIYWFKIEARDFVTSNDYPISSDIKDIAKRALSRCSGINLNNYFSISTCDIEQDIYRIGWDTIDMLHQLIWHGVQDKNSKSVMKSRDAQALLTRFKLKRFSGALQGDFLRMIKGYAQYRYGGKLQLVKQLSSGPRLEEKGNLVEQFHPTLTSLLEEIEEARRARLKTGENSKDLKLLNSLEEYYRGSDIYKLL